MIWLIHKDVFWHFKPFSNHFIGLKRYFFGFFDENLTIPLRKSLTRKNVFDFFFQNFFDENFFFEEMIWLNHNDIFWHFKPFSNYFIRLKRYFFGYSVRKTKKSIFLNTFVNKKFEFYKFSFPPYKWEKVLFSVIFPSKINDFHRLKIKIYF